MASYPTTNKTFATRSNGQVIDASHVNDLQDEVAAIEDGLLNGTARLNSSNSTVANLSVLGGSTLGTLSVSGGSTFASLRVTSTASFASSVTFAGNVTVTGTLTATGGGSGIGSKPFAVFTPAHNQPPAASFATLDLRNSHLVLDFDGASDEEAVFAGVLSSAYAGGGVTVDTYWAFTSATSGSLRVQAAIERIDASSLDIDADSFAAFQSAGGTAPGTSGQVIKVTVAFTDGAQMDSLAAGEAYRLKIRRDADGTSGTDDIASDAELLRATLRET